MWCKKLFAGYYIMMKESENFHIKNNICCRHRESGSKPFAMCFFFISIYVEFCLRALFFHHISPLLFHSIVYVNVKNLLPVQKTMRIEPSQKIFFSFSPTFSSRRFSHKKNKIFRDIANFFFGVSLSKFFLSLSLTFLEGGKRS